MKNSKMRLIKILSLIGMLALCLLLTGCVVPPEDVNANGGYVVTDGDLPFQSLNPTITGTPYTPPTSTPVPTSTPTQYPPVYATATPTSSPLPGVTPVQSTPQIIIGVSTPTPQADATTTLKKGSSGKEVERMQQRLKELGYLKGSVDGDFGDATEAAVKAFQAQNGLTVDGKAGPATLAKLYSSSARRAPTTVVTNTPRATSTPFTSYKKGDSGPEIKRMQQRLKDLGYLKGSADGDFGDATEAAVRAFQANNGLTVDGKAGSATLNKLYSSSAKRAPSDPTRTPKPTATPTPKPTATPRAESLDYYLQLGSSGTKVRTLQNRLIQLGWLEGTADGKYGPATEYAVKAFQDRYSSLWKDGIAGPDTLKLLYGAGAASAKTPASSLGMTLEPGDNGPAVTAMQKRLKELGFYKSSADGDFGNVTKSAVIAFQKANGLTADGRATTATLNKLYSADARDASYYEDDANARDEEDTDYDNDDPVAPEDSGDVTVGGYTTLRWGDTGPEVKKLQQALKNRGYYSGKLDSTFGSGVYAGVKAFQKQYGLKVDGIAGPATQMLLYNSSAPSSDTNTSLQKGSSGTKVRNLQYVLYELGYYDGPISGQYDTATVNAVRSFQSSNGLTPVDGVAGPKTLRVLYSGNAVPASAASSSSHDTLSKGSKGTAVVELQESLYNLGYLSEVTGEYDNATVEAVKNFQRRNGLSATGKADNETQRVLYSGSAKPAW